MTRQEARAKWGLPPEPEPPVQAAVTRRRRDSRNPSALERLSLTREPGEGQAYWVDRVNADQAHSTKPTWRG